MYLTYPKKKQTAYLGARVDVEVKVALEAIAKSQERSKSQLIRWILQHYVRNPELLKKAAADFF